MNIRYLYSNLFKEELLLMNSTIGELNLYTATIFSHEIMQKVISLFEKDKNLPGIIVFQNDKFYNLLSRARFYELMTKKYMLEIFSKKTVILFMEEILNDQSLILPSTTTVLEAASKALLREEHFRNDPVVVEFGNNEFKLLDFYTLITAQTKEHTSTLSSLKEVNEFKKEVLSMAAHELRNPLQSIMGFSSIIVEKAENDIELKEFSEFISDAAKEMNTVLSDLLKSALDDSKNLELSISDFKLKELIKITVSQFQPAAIKKGQKVIFNAASNDQSIIKADRTKIKEVIENLISNAIKYSPHNSIININLMVDPKSIRIDFIDEGPGFSEADMKNIFGKFNRLSAKPTGNESSTGLGLYFVKKIINQHEGKIKVTNNTAKGSTITVFLPTDLEQINLSKEEECNAQIRI